MGKNYNSGSWKLCGITSMRSLTRELEFLDSEAQLSRNVEEEEEGEKYEPLG